MVRSDLAQAAENNSVYCGIFRRDTQEPIGVISFVPHSFRGQRDYAWLASIMIQEHRSAGRLWHGSVSGCGADHFQR